MLDVIEPAPMGNNNPPTPMEEVATEYDAIICEATNWTDGEPVTTKEGLDALDKVIKEFKAYSSALGKAGDEYKAVTWGAHQDRLSEIKVYTEDANTIKAALVATGADFRKKLAAEQEAAKRAAYEEAQRLEREAAEKAANANAASLEEQRETKDALEIALEASKAAQELQKTKVKGLRKTVHYEIEDIQKALNHIAANDKPALAEFVEAYVKKHHKTATIAGVKVWETQEAY